MLRKLSLTVKELNLTEIIERMRVLDDKKIDKEAFEILG